MNQLISKMNHLIARLDHTEKQAKDEFKLLTQSESHVRDVEQAQTIVQTVAEQIQNMVHKQLASIVTKCLHAVFGKNSYEFVINFRQLRGKTEAELKLVTKDGLELDPLDSTGGGVVDVVSFALRLAGLVLARPQKRRFLALDEPFRFVSRGYSPRIAELVSSLANDLDFQILFITHNRKLEIGKVYRIGVSS